MSNSRSRIALLFFSFVLTFYGLLMLRSSTQPLPRGSTLFIKQCMWCGIAFCFFLFFAYIHLQKLQRFGLWIGMGTIGLLMLVLLPGVSRSIKGSHRWIECGGLRLQASEPAKVGFILFFAYFLSHHMEENQGFWKGFVRPMLVVGIFCGLLIVEPDFGTTALFGLVAVLLLFIRGLRLAFLLPATVVSSLLFSIAVYCNPVRLRRILAFLDLENNRTAGGYQLWQSLLAFSSGGWFGCGLGQGRQQFFFLPEAHTDFIGAVLAEELGIVHAVILLCCFGAIAYAGLRIVRQQTDCFLFYVGLGAVCFITIQVFLNLGVITGLLPTKGIALPFLSYGGSNLVANACLIGLLVNLSRDLYSPFRMLQK
ncbi:MAG: cell division protein FtsW [Opitutales bacterium]|nr:cell division protein FtsW [Opitutales bacterium]